MQAYVPSGLAIVVELAFVLLAMLLVGFAIPRWLPLGVARAVSWLFAVVGTTGVERLFAHEPPGVRMLAVISFALLGMKTIVVVEECGRGMAPLPFVRWSCFAAGWLGMQPRLFAERRVGGVEGAAVLALRGLVRIAVGCGLLLLGRLAWRELHSVLLATACALSGLSFVLHFGWCNLLAGLWRACGFRCDALFRAPLRSQSLAEFWARRWNVAFSEMTSIAVYRPLASRVGRSPALLAGFLMSGLLHEMAISVPVKTGFGLPLLYFALHGGLVLAERALAAAGRPVAGWPGRAWTVFWLLAPLPVLFHPPFLAGVVWPLVGVAVTSSPR